MNRNLRLVIGCGLLFVGLIVFGIVTASLRTSNLASMLIALAGPSAVIMIAVISIATTISEATPHR